MKTQLVPSLIVSFVTAFAFTPFAISRQQADPKGSSTWHILPGTEDATVDNPLVVMVPIKDPTVPGGIRNVPVKIPDEGEDTLEHYDPRKETYAQASKRKADRVKAAIDREVAKGKLPATVTSGTAAAPQTPVPSGMTWDPRSGFKVIYLKQDLTKVTAAGIGGPLWLDKDPSNQAGNSLQFTPGGTQQQQPTPKFNPSMRGTATPTGAATGLTRDGDVASVNFGFYNPDDPDVPSYLAGVQPMPGESDGSVLSRLAATFNTDFSEFGYIAAYDAQRDLLSLSNASGMPTWDYAAYLGSSDMGLAFSVEQVPVGSSEVPEPSGLTVLAAGILALARRKRSSPRHVR